LNPSYYVSGRIMKKFKGLLAAAALVAVAFVPVSAQAAPLSVPKTSWPVCSEVRVTYCVESASIQSIGGVAEPLVWTAVASSKLGGLWTTESWATNHAGVGYDGIFFNVKTANVFTNHLSVDALPATAAGIQADQPDNAGFPVSLNLDDVLSFTVRIGEILPGISIGVGSTLNITEGSGANGATLTFSGTPVPVADAANIRTCSTEDGVAVSDSDQFGAYVIVENDDQGFGVDGLTGKMNITSNGVCDMSTPSWDTTTGSLTWKASAPHFKKDGSVNLGVYRAVIPAADAALLWGLTRPQDAVSALTVQVTNDGTNKVAAIKKIAYKGGNIIIEHSGFQYSTNKFVIKKKPGYKKFAPLKKRTCKQIKPSLPGPNKITQKAGACPAGYKA
jgi:hypothetical protein